MPYIWGNGQRTPKVLDKKMTRDKGAPIIAPRVMYGTKRNWGLKLYSRDCLCRWEHAASELCKTLAASLVSSSFFSPRAIRHSIASVRIPVVSVKAAL